MSRPRVLFISYESVGRRMTGLGIRYTELARVLAGHAEVTVAAPSVGDSSDDGVEQLAFRPHAPGALRPAIEAADLIVAQPQWPLTARWLASAKARVVYDLYDPETFGTLELFAGRRLHVRRLMGQLTLDRLHDALATGDRFICASEKQRDLWLGVLLGQRRIDPELHDRDPSLRSVLATVPFGLPADPPSPPTGAMGPRERFGEVGQDTELVLWNGGVWNWLDAPTAVRAVIELAQHRPGVRLVFMGAAARSAGNSATERARAMAAELDPSGTVVHFNTDWVPYGERATWLAQADCAISTHTDHLESRFAFRTRALDCFWAGVPIVCSLGDTLADRVERDGLGAVSPPGDASAMAAALERVLDRGREAYAPALRTVAADYAWPRVAQPLIDWTTSHRPRLGTAPGAVRRTAGHRARAAVYLVGGRVALDRRSD